MLDSDLSSSLRNSRRYSRRSTPAVLTVLSVVVAASSITPATANPIPFLDFLYPTFHISTSKHSCSSSTSPTSTSKSSRSSANPQSPATGAGAAIVAEQEQYGLLQRRQSEYSKPKLRKRATSKGRKVPVKYESSDDGWSPADIWTLHGRRNPTDVSLLQFLLNFLFLFAPMLFLDTDDHIMHRGDLTAATSYLYNIFLTILHLYFYAFTI